MIQAEEHPGSVVGFRASRRQEIKSKSVSTLKPSLRSSIIFSTLNPACSPAMANLPIALSNVDVAISSSPGELSSREWHGFRRESVILITHLCKPQGRKDALLNTRTASATFPGTTFTVPVVKHAQPSSS